MENDIKENKEDEENKVNKVNNNKSLIIVIIVLVICVLGLSGYIIYDKFLSDNSNTNENENNIQKNDENNDNSQNNNENENNSDNDNENESDSNNKDNKEEKLDINSSIANELKSKVFDGFYNDSFLIKKDNQYEYGDVYKVNYAITKLIKDNKYVEKEINYVKTKIFSLENVEKVINDNFSNNSITDYKVFDANVGGGAIVYQDYTNPYPMLISYDEQEKSFYYKVVPTGGMSPRVYPLYQFDFIDIEKKDNYYYLTANVLLYSESQDEYKCAFEAPNSKYELKVYADLDKNNLIYEKKLEVPCTEKFEEYVKNNINTSEYVSKATKYRFKFTSDKKYIDIEKV